MQCMNWNFELFFLFYDIKNLFQTSLQFSKDAQVSKSAKDLILNLCTDSKARLGYEGLVCHQFFSGIDWNNLQESMYRKNVWLQGCQ